MLFNKKYNIKKYNILVLGANGMLGKEVLEFFQKLSVLKNSCVNIVHGIDIDTLDIAVKDALYNYMYNSVHYDVCVNCAAITNTVEIETDAKVQNLSYKVNALALTYIADACLCHGTKLIHISTDYIFSQFAQDPTINRKVEAISTFGFAETDTPFPINIYGLHKLLGECNIKKSKCNYAILRVSWLYGKYNNKSFVHKILKKAAKTKQLSCVDDEISMPTNCENLCHRIMNVITCGLRGIFNACDLPEVEQSQPGISRYEFAEAIISEFEFDNAIKGTTLTRCKQDDFDAQMRYPKYSVLAMNGDDDINYGTLTWREALSEFCANNYDELIKYAVKD